MNKKYMVLALAFCFVLITLFSSFIAAEAEVTYNVYEALIKSNGTVVLTTNPVNDAKVVSYICSDVNCSTVTRRLEYEKAITGNTVAINYPTQLQGTGYGVYFYKSGYIGWKVHANWAGTGKNNSVAYLAKEEGARANIIDFDISDTSIQEGEHVEVEVLIDSARFNTAKKPQYVPVELEEINKVKTNVVFEVRKGTSLVYSDSEILNIAYSDKDEAGFEYRFMERGNYTIKVYTDISSDGKFITSLRDEETREISVTEGDIIKPEINVLSPMNITYNTRTISINASSNQVVEWSYVLNGNLSENVAQDITFNRNINVLEGRNTLSIIGENRNGTDEELRVFYVNTSLPVDNLSPIVTINSPNKPVYNLSSVLINLTATDNVVVSKIWFNINNGVNSSFNSANNIILADGNYIIRAYANDSAGNIGTNSFSFAVNTSSPLPPSTLPVIALFSPINKTYNSTNILLNASSNQIVNWSYNLNGILVSAINNSNQFNSLINARNGSNTLIVFGTNVNGTSNKSVSFFVNTSAPNPPTTLPIITILSPIEGKTYESSIIALKVISDQVIDGWSYRLNNGTLHAFTPNITFSAVKGYNVLAVYGTNVNGTGFATKHFYYNKSEEKKEEERDCFEEEIISLSDAEENYNESSGINLVEESEDSNFTLWLYFLIILVLLIIIILVIILISRYS